MILFLAAGLCGPAVARSVTFSRGTRADITALRDFASGLPGALLVVQDRPVGRPIGEACICLFAPAGAEC